ncbi:MAG: universal stress protein, partial [Halobacteriales archaeon]
AEKLEEEAPAVVTEETPDHRDYRLLVPVANPATVEQLMRTAIDLANERDGEIVVMTVVTVPQQTPLAEGRQFVDEERAVLDEAMAIGEEAGVPVSGAIRIGHDVSRAVLNTIEAESADAVLLGWRGRSQRRDVVFGSNVDEVITKAPCDVLVERIGPRPDGVDRILLPTAGGPHAELSAEVARAIARANDATVSVVTVVEPDATARQRDASRDRLERVAGLVGDGVAVETDLIDADDVVDAIVDRSADADVTLVGATREGLFQQLLFGAIPEQVARRVDGTVIMAKRSRGLASRLRRWFRRRSS